MGLLHLDDLDEMARRRKNWLEPKWLRKRIRLFEGGSFDLKDGEEEEEERREGGG